MSNKKFNAMEALKKKLNNHSQNIGIPATNNTIIENENNSLVKIDKDNFDMFDLKTLNDWGIENAEDLKFCTEKIVKIGNYISNTALELGKDFEEIFQRFSHQGSENGTYVKIIEFLGFNRRTILRHRKRYSLFILTDSIISKQIIAGLSVKSIDLIDKIERNELKENLDKITSKSEFTELIKSLDYDNYEQQKLLAPEDLIKTDDEKKEEKKEEKKIYEKEITDKSYETSENILGVDNILGIFEDYEDRYKELNNDDKEKLSSLIKEISAILKK